MPVDRSQFSSFLEKLAESLEVQASRYDEAEKHYKAVGNWLGEDGSPLAPYDPEIYPQGSFRLGTAIKPLSEADEYDIDLACELSLSRNEVSQKQLKQLVGDRLKAHETYRRMLGKDEGRRCWTLNYADGAQFHMDILPTIPDEENYKLMLTRYGVPAALAAHAICITDNTYPNFDKIDADWPRSNPKGYAEWFKYRMKVLFEARLRAVAESMKASVEEVPEYRVKTPLQQAVQILKRHRDIMFCEDKDDKPISIIITTLAAHAYSNEEDLLDALTSIVNGMPAHILSQGGASWVPNPVNPLENFADKWQEHPERELKFREWLRQVQGDLNRALEQGELRAAGDVLRPRFGLRAVNEALSVVAPVAAIHLTTPKSDVPHVDIRKPNKPWGRRD
jgi:hypothetical protein